MPYGIMPDSARQEGSATTYGLINSIIAWGKRPLTVKINGVARFSAAAAKLRAQSFTLDGEGVVCGPPALR
jgi:hypothetical protein